MIEIKRICEPPSADDAHRVLVDRVWPRVASKEAAKLDDWMKDVTPSPELRIWFDHDPKRPLEFKLQYLFELKGVVRNACVSELNERGLTGTLTLLFAAKDDRHNHSLILLEILRREQN